MRGLDASTLVATQHWGDLNFGIDGYLLSAAPANLTLLCVRQALLIALLALLALARGLARISHTLTSRSHAKSFRQRS